MRLVAAPHSAEATVKPITENRNTYLMPKRPASQPVSGVMIAAATMYEVTTQATWSCEADKLPWMCGSATLAIVVSTPCMIVAQVIEAVIAARLSRRPAAGSPPAAAPARPLDEFDAMSTRAIAANRSQIAAGASRPGWGIVGRGMQPCPMPATALAGHRFPWWAGSY